MNALVCTLYEGDYHHGVATLVNSLAKNGFRGTVCVAYRGALPPWASAALPVEYPDFDDARRLPLLDGPELVFLPLQIDHHLANYKPDLMLRLLRSSPADIGGIFYFDPDITVVKTWRLFEQWISCGVAVCEDVNSPIGLHHPRRIGWRQYFGRLGIELAPRTCEYFNSGFVGVRREDESLLQTWITIGSGMAAHIGGSAATEVGGGAQLVTKGFFDCFDRTDQDCLNAAIEASPYVVCAALPPSAMAFSAGDFFLPHAVGAHKPWRRKYLRESLRGFAPTVADKAFWAHARGPLASMPGWRIATSAMRLQVASAISRIYQRR